MIYSVLHSDFYEDINFKTVDIDGIKLTVIDRGNGTGEIFNVISSDPKDYLNRKYTPGNIIKY